MPVAIAAMANFHVASITPATRTKDFVVVAIRAGFIVVVMNVDYWRIAFVGHIQ